MKACRGEELTELAGGQLLALGVLGDEADVDALHVDVHVVRFHVVVRE